MMVSILGSKIKRFSALMAVSGVIAASFLVPLSVAAVPLGPDDPNPLPSTGSNNSGGNSTNTDQSTTGITPKKNDCYAPYNQLNKNNCGIIKYVVVLTNILSALVGVIIVISITWAGIQYSMSKSDPQAVVAARSRISNGVLALVVYIFMIAFLQWLVPGGVF